MLCSGDGLSISEKEAGLLAVSICPQVEGQIGTHFNVVSGFN